MPLWISPIAFSMEIEPEMALLGWRDKGVPADPMASSVLVGQMGALARMGLQAKKEGRGLLALTALPVEME